MRWCCSTTRRSSRPWSSTAARCPSTCSRSWPLPKVTVDRRKPAGHVLAGFPVVIERRRTLVWWGGVTRKTLSVQGKTLVLIDSTLPRKSPSEWSGLLAAPQFLEIHFFGSAKARNPPRGGFQVAARRRGLRDSFPPRHAHQAQGGAEEPDGGGNGNNSSRIHKNIAVGPRCRVKLG